MQCSRKYITFTCVSTFRHLMCCRLSCCLCRVYRAFFGQVYLYWCIQSLWMCICILLIKTDSPIWYNPTSLCSVVWMLNPDKTNTVQHKKKSKWRKRGDGQSPADPGQTEACCLLRHPACNLLLHNPKTDYLVKNRHEPVSLGKWWGLVSCEPRTLWQPSMITSWGGSVSILHAQGGFVARKATHCNSLAFT